MRNFITGASSQIGCYLLPMLARQQEAVLALSRRTRTSALPAVQWCKGQLPDVDLPHRPDSVLSLGPLDELAAWLGRWPYERPARVVAISSMSALSKRESPIVADRAVAERLRRGEASVMEACDRIGAPWTIIRPTMIYGAGIDRNLSLIARWASRTRILPVPVASGLRQPVHASDVARAVLAARDAAGVDGRVLELGGGERITVESMFDRVAASLSTSVWRMKIPLRLLQGLSLVVPSMRGPVDRLQADLVADNREVERLLGIRPAGFGPDAGTWEPMAQ